MNDAEVTKYLELIATEILKANPAYSKQSLRILFSRSYYANASSMGEGTILFNAGLFHRLQNESQAAFVLSHELAHYFLNHSNDNIHQYVATVNSTDFQKKLKTIQKSDYGQNKQLELLAKSLAFRNRRHSRQFEQAADSLALELMKNTNYDVQEALTVLALLDSADKDKYRNGLALEKQFHFPTFPFKKRWLESDDLIFIETKDENETKEEDSLKTHPDCKLRIARLTDRVNQYRKESRKKFVVNEQQFAHIKKLFDYEIIDYSYNSKQLSKALYLTLQMLSSFPDDVYLNTMVGKCLNEMYIAQKNHQLGKLVDLPGKGFDEEYNSLLRMIQNLRLAEIASLSYHFLKNREALLSSYEPFIQVYSISKQHFLP